MGWKHGSGVDVFRNEKQSTNKLTRILERPQDLFICDACTMKGLKPPLCPAIPHGGYSIARSFAKRTVGIPINHNPISRTISIANPPSPYPRPRHCSFRFLQRFCWTRPRFKKQTPCGTLQSTYTTHLHGLPGCTSPRSLSRSPLERQCVSDRTIAAYTIGPRRLYSSKRVLHTVLRPNSQRNKLIVSYE